MRNRPIQSGEIVIFKIEGRETPLVHRVIKVHRQHDSKELRLFTKGDANTMDDSYGIYADCQLWLGDHHIIGRVMGYIPYIGWVAIMMGGYPLIKYLLVAGRRTKVP